MDDEAYEDEIKNCPDYPYCLGDWSPDGEDEAAPRLDPDAPMD